MPANVQLITSRDNPLVQRLRKLAQDPAAYRKLGEVWLEGDHLCSAYLARGKKAAVAVVADTAWLGEHGLGNGGDPLAYKLTTLARQADKVMVLPESIWKVFTGLESPARLGFLVQTPLLGDGQATSEVRAGVPTVVLDRVQDAGNVGSILRSASALGVSQVVAMKGTAALWSPKVLRAGMGAHFALHLVEQALPEHLAGLLVPMVATSSHADHELPRAPLPEPCAWVLGHEGQGVGAEVMALCAHTVSIPQPGGEESLNVAAAAAVCFYESLRRRSVGI
ncbi:RNA methyltransferase [Aquabacterium sp.]|uniref:TrmH family RNA methyltransferase n=1 Tax=Aquabacterium sp. TaxID=1872578 RepID=UPI0019BCFC53|nr:RNA methyltransferase [Aquabacterium sp.]MBC7700758.1 RNA methyltransferase [Aquabacterium sp.]